MISLRELVYFLVALGILLSRKQLSRIWTWKSSMHLPFMLPQNFGIEFDIQKKVLTFCWPRWIGMCTKVFLKYFTCYTYHNPNPLECIFGWMSFHHQNIILVWLMLLMHEKQSSKAKIKSFNSWPMWIATFKKVAENILYLALLPFINIDYHGRTHISDFFKSCLKLKLQLRFHSFHCNGYDLMQCLKRF